MFDFISKLLPSIGKNRILEDITVTKGELETLGEVYKEAAQLFKTLKVNNPDVKAQFDQFKRIVGTGGDNMVVYIDRNLEQIGKNLNMIERLIEATLNNTIAAQGLTIKQANILEYVQKISFVLRYARKNLHYIYVLESSQYEADPKSALLALYKPDVLWLQENFVNFATAFKSVSKDSEDTRQKLENVPEATLTDKTLRTLSATLGADQLDPLRLGLSGSYLNPIYFVRMMVAEWQVRRYKASKEEVTALRLRRLQLEQQRDGKENAKLEREIEYTENRIQNLLQEQAEMEKQ